MIVLQSWLCVHYNLLYNGHICGKGINFNYVVDLQIKPFSKKSSINHFNIICISEDMFTLYRL